MFRLPSKPHERLPQRKQMTIAIGLLGRDGIVMAADTQESTGDYMKGEKRKVAAFAFTESHPDYPVGVCVISGAGDSGYVRALTMKLGMTFGKNKDLMPTLMVPNGDLGLEDKFAECLQKFYKEDIVPFAHFPERSRPDVEMLIAVRRKGLMDLFSTEKTTITQVLPYKAIGLGSVFAELMLNRLWDSASVAQLELLAAYVVFMAKESIESCGKYTTIATIHTATVVDTPSGSRFQPPGPAVYVKRDTIEEWEHLFRYEWWKAEKDVIWKLIEHRTNRSGPRRSKGRQ